MGPRAGLDDMEKWKFFTLPGLEPRPLVVQPVTSRYTDCAKTKPLVNIAYPYNLFRFQMG
jgi:hypothetical protein